MPANNYTRRELLKLGSAGAATLGTEPALISVADARPIGPVAESGGCCLTTSGDFHNVERGSPVPYRLPMETQREIGMLRETWQLEILADPGDEAKIDRPMLKANGTALTFGALMKLAEKKAVSFLKVITCNNL
jgi:hypothetical protein